MQSDDSRTTFARWAKQATNVKASCASHGRIELGSALHNKCYKCGRVRHTSQRVCVQSDLMGSAWCAPGSESGRKALCTTLKPVCVKYGKLMELAAYHKWENASQVADSFQMLRQRWLAFKEKENELRPSL